MDAAAAGPGAVPSVSVVICCYALRRWEDVQRAVSSIRGQSVPPRETIVVVDHNDELLARARGSFLDEIVVPNREARGLSGARNTGWRRATADVVAFLDDDAWAGPSWVAEVGARMAEVDVIAAGGTITADWAGGRPPWWPEEFDWVVGCTYRGLPTAVAEVRNVIGANMAFRRDVLEEVGGFRGELGRLGAGAAGCEETEICIRARAARPEGRVLYDPRLHVDHRVPAERSQLRYFLRRCVGEGVSKARLARMSSPGDALSTERRYVTRTLPRAVGRNLAQGVRDRDRWGVGRAGAVVLGLAATTFGYARGRLGRT